MINIRDIIYRLFIGSWLQRFFPNITRNNYWTRFQLQDFTSAEWENLCDGCGLCCLYKFESQGGDKIEFTNVACRLLDCGTCQCNHYEARKKIVNDCVKIDLQLLNERAYWLPSTCAYRLLFENKPLFDWHHLISGDRNTVHEKGVSVRGWIIPETEVQEHEIQNHIIEVEQQ